MTIKSSQKFILSAKRFYWTRRQDPLGWHAMNKWRRTISRAVISAAKVARYAVTGKSHSGFCPICDQTTTFIKRSTWLRDNYLCEKCHSIPRIRHIIYILQKQFPGFREWAIHESSPSGSSFDKLRKECPGYLPTYYWPDTAPGTQKNGFRCENLEALTFADASFDLVITQDVMEHVLNPDRAFSEIARTLKPGGAHVFTVPWYAPKPTFIRAAEAGERIEHFAEKDYHGNPIDEGGALVVTEWGINLPEFIFKHSGLITTIFITRDRHMGLAGEFLEVFVSRKSI